METGHKNFGHLGRGLGLRQGLAGPGGWSRVEMFGSRGEQKMTKENRAEYKLMERMR